MPSITGVDSPMGRKSWEVLRLHLIFKHSAKFAFCNLLFPLSGIAFCGSGLKQ